MEKKAVSVRLELRFTFNICYMESAFVKVVTLFFFITNVIKLYVIIFTHANYKVILETRHVSMIWNTFCGYSVVTEYHTYIKCYFQ
jgi:hypothetical protein